MRVCIGTECCSYQVEVNNLMTRRLTELTDRVSLTPLIEDIFS